MIWGGNFNHTSNDSIAKRKSSYAPVLRGRSIRRRINHPIQQITGQKRIAGTQTPVKTGNSNGLAGMTPGYYPPVVSEKPNEQYGLLGCIYIQCCWDCWRQYCFNTRHHQPRRSNTDEDCWRYNKTVWLYSAAQFPVPCPYTTAVMMATITPRMLKTMAGPAMFSNNPVETTRAERRWHPPAS